MNNFLKVMLAVLIIVAGDISLTTGQNYIPMVKEGNKVELKMPVGWGQYAHSLQRIYCDTLIAGNLYKKVYHVNTANCNYAGAIREDTVNQKVYFLNPNASQEILFIDFNVNVGDTVAWGAWGASNTNIVMSVNRSFMYGKNRKTVNFNLGSWIEGIGSSVTGVSQFSCFSNMHFLHDFQELPLADCSPNILGKADAQFPKLTIYPNPATDKLRIESEGKENHFPGVYSIINTLGKEVGNGMLKEAKSDINVQNIPSGLYFLSVKLKDKNQVFKVLIER